MANYYNKDLYKILDLTYEATLDDIKKAYRKLAKTYHPDVAKGEVDINKFREIKEAYDILSDIEARKKYDVLHGYYREKMQKEYEKKLEAEKKARYEEYIKKAKVHAQKAEPFTKSFNEAIDTLFKSSKKPKQNFQKEEVKKEKKQAKKEEKKEKPFNGDDINMDLTISCFEAINGTNRKVNILHTQPCHKCSGHKFINDTQCPMCKGSGLLSIQKKINVKIPKGVSQGSKVRVKGEGNSGLNGGKDGDLYLIINVEKNPYYEFDGLNILCNLPITPSEAVFGADVSIPTTTGKIKVKIPPMTSSGQKLKIANEGLENKNKTKKGDIIITVLIKLPQELSKDELDLYEELQHASKFDIRGDMKNVK